MASSLYTRIRIKQLLCDDNVHEQYLGSPRSKDVFFIYQKLNGKSIKKYSDETAQFKAFRGASTLHPRLDYNS